MAEVNKRAVEKANVFLDRIAAEAGVTREEMRVALLEALNTEAEKLEEEENDAPREENR